MLSKNNLLVSYRTFSLFLYLLFDSRMLRSRICESLRSLKHSNCVKFNQAALSAVLKRGNACHQAHKHLCVRFKYVSFYRLSQSFQSLFGSLFSLVFIAVWIYFNRLQNTEALELFTFVIITEIITTWFEFIWENIRENILRYIESNTENSMMEYICYKYTIICPYKG